MVENLELQKSKESNLSDTVDNLSNAIVSPEVSEVLGKFAANSNYPDDSEAEEISEVLEHHESEMESDTNPDSADLELTKDFDFEHFFDGDFGQTSKQPSHDQPSIRGLK